MMRYQGIALGDLETQANALRRDGATALFAAIDGKPGGVIAVADPIKTSTPEALNKLRQDGIHIVMLTGDNGRVAWLVGNWRVA